LKRKEAKKLLNAIAPLTFFEKKVSKETSNATAPLNSLLSGATAYKVLGALHPLRAGALHPLRAGALHPLRALLAYFLY